MKKRKEYLYRPSKKPKHEKLSWPGLKAKDHLSRVATRAVKEAKETRENEEWAESLIARMLDYVPPETAMRLLFQETFRRRKPDARSKRSPNGLSEFVWDSQLQRVGEPDVIPRQIKENKAVIL